MIKTIVKDQLFLQRPSVETTKDDLYLAQDLRDTLAANREACVGMAANMIGESKRVIIVNMGFFDIVMFNPKLESHAKPYQTEESCLSLTGSRPTQRYEEIKVSYRDEQWMPKTLTLKGFQAQICQHELDHLEGILI